MIPPFASVPLLGDVHSTDTLQTQPSSSAELATAFLEGLEGSSTGACNSGGDGVVVSQAEEDIFAGLQELEPIAVAPNTSAVPPPNPISSSVVQV